MSTQAKLADLLLREAGRGGLWEWAMDERRSVTPAPWDDVAKRLAEVTDSEIKIGGAMLRRWVLDAETKKRTH